MPHILFPTLNFYHFFNFDSSNFYSSHFFFNILKYCREEAAGQTVGYSEELGTARTTADSMREQLSLWQQKCSESGVCGNMTNILRICYNMTNILRIFLYC